jgi:mannose-6-phosphate isomerase
MLYPLKFKPILKEKIWGGDKLKSKSKVDFSQKRIGESWEISGVDGDISIVQNGALAGKTLSQLISEFKTELVGEVVFEKYNGEFPILIKFIEAQENLSVQLHPSDTLAKKRHNSFGKTEMWYITEAEPNAELIVGFKESITVDRYKDSLAKGQLEDVLNKIKVEEGEVFFIKPGLVHAIGAGVTLAEIQQTSDVTYRLYDWLRVDKEGRSRELHTELALEAIDFQVNSDYKIEYDSIFNSKVPLVDSPYFKTNFLEINQRISLDYSSVDSFIIYLNVGTQIAELTHNKNSFVLFPMETILLPACIQTIEFKSSGTKLLEISI